MAKGGRRQRVTSRQFRSTPYLFRFDQDATDDSPQTRHRCKASENRDYEDVTCSVCMEFPHNAVLLLCSSHDKGCRPYMCGTSYRHSNCLDQYKKAYTKVAGDGETPPDSGDLACPLCRGQVKGWTVVEPAREFLNSKRRSCMHDECSFLGNYKELRKHVKAEHPSARPREVDPAVEQKWRRLERERERNDVISTITSAMPGAMFFGDYVIEGNASDSDDDAGFDAVPERNVGFDSNLVNVFLLLHAFGPPGGDGARVPAPAFPFAARRTAPIGDAESSDREDDGDGRDEGDMSLAGRLRRQGRVLLGRSGRRRRQREMNDDVAR